MNEVRTMEKAKASKAQIKANNQYNRKAYDRITFAFLKGKKDIYKSVAEAAGYKNLGTFVEDLMDTLAASKGYSEQVKEVNGGTVNRQRKEIVLHEAAPEAAEVFSEIIK